MGEQRRHPRRGAEVVDQSPDAPIGMRLVPAGTFTMGSNRFYPEEAPTRRVHVDDFFIDETPVTNAMFACFVAETGHVTFAEIAPDPQAYPGMPPQLAQPGSAVFCPPSGAVDMSDPSQWWRFVVGADWRHPAGPDSTIDGLDDHPVVHMTIADAEAYARWAGKALPTEAEWERAARGGLEDADYAWGDELAPGGRVMANIWHGVFPYGKSAPERTHGTSAVRSFDANGFGLYDMVGNVWEWTSDWYAPHRLEKKPKGSCCVPVNPRGARRHDSFEPGVPSRTPRKVLKGGSYLCAANHCRRYRPAARQPEPIDTSTSHIGFRCVLRRRR